MPAAVQIDQPSASKHFVQLRTEELSAKPHALASSELARPVMDGLDLSEKIMVNRIMLHMTMRL